MTLFYQDPGQGSERNKFDVEYSLRGIDKPVGVAGYELTHNVPEKLKDSLPSPEELEEKILLELWFG